MEGERSIAIFQDGLGDGGQKMRTLHGRTSGPTRRSTKGQWTPEEDEILQKAVQRFKGKNWKKIAECFKDRTDVQCLHRWQKVLNPELVKGPWSKEEDEIIIELVNKYGPKKWSTIAQHLPGRIGKQCRERWHNHLNPAINKEAWTQEEELALIRAHQIYGNRWAELTKFLPGRTDNAIKNHWNSSVKKKLDSYLASGLLAQFPAHPLVGPQNQPIQSMPVSSLRMQGSGDDSGPKGVEAEEISECSQDSTVAGCFQSASEMANAVLHTREEFSLTEESGLGKEQSASPASCSEQYYTSLEDGAFTISDIPCEVGCSSKFLEQNFSGDAGTSAGSDHQFNLHALPNISSLELRQESSQLQTHCIGTNEGQEMVNVPCQTSVGLSTSMGYTAMGSHNPERILISDDECCRVLFSDAMYDGCFFSGNHTRSSNMVASGGCTDSFRDILISDTGGTSSSQLDCPPRSDIMGTSCSQSFVSVPSLVSVDGDALIYGDEPNQFFGSQEQEFVPSVHDDFIYTNGTANSPCNDGTDNTGMQEQPECAKESSKLVPVNNFGSGSDITHTCPSMGERPNVHAEQQDTGALCYEPPRFPSLDIPFFSCDLIQSGTDMQQEYSPLGIRQFMMSSMNCVTPFRSWDSPSRDDSPDALLKSAAKTFTGTPSILKKRNRDFLSPLSEKRSDKKLFNTSCLAKDFSRLDVMFDDSGTHKVPPISPSSNRKAPPVSPSSNRKRDSGAFIKDKENSGHAFEGGEVMATDGAAFSDDRISEKGFDNSNSQDMIKQGTVDVDTAVQIVRQPSGVLAEHDMNDLLLHSPDQIGFKADRVLLGSSARTPRNRHFRNLAAASSHGISSKTSSGNPCAPVISPTTCGKKHESHSVAVTCIQSASSSSPLGTTGTNTGNDASIEPYNIFGVTPSKRSMESPSAWMSSPWFINSFLPGPRIDTEITIEDIGYFMSPGDRSYDAIGLMKQISEHTAAAYANAQEVLGNETPKTLLKEKYTKHGNLDQENNQVQHNQLGNRSHLAPNVLTERRTLDFSECGTPRKGTENGKSSNAISSSSPSSYLLKSCR